MARAKAAVPKAKAPATAPKAVPKAAPAEPAKVPASPAPGRVEACVFLDFDHTIIEGDAGPLFGWYLFKWRRRELAGRWFARMRLWARYLPFLTWMGVQAVLHKARARKRSSIIRAGYKGLRGVPAATFHQLMDEFAREAIVPRVYPEMAAVVRGHLEAGRRCVVVTTGIEVLVRKVLDHLDPRIELIGCRLRERNGKFTGRVDGPLFGLDKANILHAYCRALRLDAKDAWAYSDHWSDKHMLEAVGHPVAVNPRGRLRRLARRSGWQVLEPSLPAHA